MKRGRMTKRCELRNEVERGNGLNNKEIWKGIVKSSLICVS